MKPSKRTDVADYYLNDYGEASPRFRIETVRGGQRTIWHDKVRYGGMADAQKYIESVWAQK